MIVTCGEALVDLIPEPVAGRTLYRPVLGGSLYTVAVGVARLGGRAGYAWELSADTLGQSFLASLREAKVDTSAVVVTDRATPVALVDLSRDEARYTIADPDGVMVDTRPADLPAGAECLVIGSAVLAREPVAAAIEAWSERAPLLAIDYNVRPPSVVDREGYLARLRRLSLRAGLVKASRADLEALGIADPADHMRALVAKGGVAVLTAAEAGASAFTATREIHRPSRARTVVDTVGAGDAFMAAALVHLQRTGALSAAALADPPADLVAAMLDFAQTVAATTCASRGARIPNLDEILVET